MQQCSTAPCELPKVYTGVPERKGGGGGALVRAASVEGVGSLMKVHVLTTTCNNQETCSEFPPEAVNDEHQDTVDLELGSQNEPGGSASAGKAAGRDLPPLLQITHRILPY